jgi:hypothetical protein
VQQLVLDIISSAGFGVYIGFGNGDIEKETETLFMEKAIPEGYQRTYRASLEIFNRNIFGVHAVVQI